MSATEIRRIMTLLETAFTPEAIQAKVHEIIEALAEEWGAGGVHPHVTCRGHINMGPCSEFAEEAAGLIEEALPGVPVEVLDTDWVGENYEDVSEDYHAFLRVGSRFYDSSPVGARGVADPRELPTVWRSVQMARMARDRDDYAED